MAQELYCQREGNKRNVPFGAGDEDAATIFSPHFVQNLVVLSVPQLWHLSPDPDAGEDVVAEGEGDGVVFGEFRNEFDEGVVLRRLVAVDFVSTTINIKIKNTTYDQIKGECSDASFIIIETNGNISLRKFNECD